MIGERILASTSPGEVRVAVLRGARLLDYAMWRPGRPDGVGDIHRGRVTAVMPAMAGAFVALADGDGFLPDSEGAKGLTEGIILPVRVTRAALGGKGPRLSNRETGSVPAGPVGLVQRGPNPIERFLALYPDATVTRGDDTFGDDIETQIEALADPVVSLPGGASLSIYPTPALVAIDTDSGGRQDGHAGFNRAVIPSIAREIRLRNLSGAIVVDLAGLPMRQRSSLSPTIVASLAEDPLKPRFLGFSALGLAEILRNRVHPPLHELLAGPHAAGLAALRQIVRNLDPNPRRLPVLRAAPAVVEALQRDPVALTDMAGRAGRALVLRSDPSLSATDWKLEQDHG